MAARAKTSGGKARGGFATLLLTGGVLALAMALPALALLVAIGSLPTIVARIIERPEQRHLASCVGLLNVAGVLPAVYQFAEAGFKTHALGPILLDLTVWAAMYGAAGAGWGIHLVVPAMTVALARRRLEREQRLLRIRQKQLNLEWGPEVTGEA